jgi:hypothetical protein
MRASAKECAVTLASAHGGVGVRQAPLKVEIAQANHGAPLCPFRGLEAAQLLIAAIEDKYRRRKRALEVVVNRV